MMWSTRPHSERCETMWVVLECFGTTNQFWPSGTSMTSMPLGHAKWHFDAIGTLAMHGNSKEIHPETWELQNHHFYLLCFAWGSLGKKIRLCKCHIVPSSNFTWLVDNHPFIDDYPILSRKNWGFPVPLKWQVAHWENFAKRNFSAHQDYWYLPALNHYVYLHLLAAKPQLCSTYRPFVDSRSSLYILPFYGWKHFLG